MLLFSVFFNFNTFKEEYKWHKDEYKCQIGFYMPFCLNIFLFFGTPLPEPHFAITSTPSETMQMICSRDSYGAGNPGLVAVSSL